MSDLFSELQWRGIVYDASEGAADALRSGKVTCYIGFDPTASSLHVGSLLPVMALARLQRFGHHPIAIAGGGTGLIGDPSGKTQERQLLTLEQVEQNVEGIKAQLAHFLDFHRPDNPARIVNNAEWLTKLDLMGFLRDIGKHFTVNYMLAKESVKARVRVFRSPHDKPTVITVPTGEIKTPGHAPVVDESEGMSFTEFSYMLLQSYDYLMMFDRYGCTMQMGGSDQWGNITAGIDLIRRLRGRRTHGLVMPLVTTAAGVKFGKTEAGAIWLDPARTSPFRFYQFWLNTDDRDAVSYLKFFTFRSQEEIEELAAESAKAPESRTAQRALARDVTRLVHGEDDLARAERASAVLFGAELSDLTVDEVLDVFEDVPSSELDAARFEGEGTPLTELLVATGLVASKGEATRLIRSGGVYVNTRRVADERGRLRRNEAIEGRLFVLRRGQRQTHLVKLRK